MRYAEVSARVNFGVDEAFMMLAQASLAFKRAREDGVDRPVAVSGAAASFRHDAVARRALVSLLGAPSCIAAGKPQPAVFV